VRGLMKTDISEKDKNVYDDIINDYIPSAKLLSDSKVSNSEEISAHML
jgi:hypothetical protein